MATQTEDEADKVPSVDLSEPTAKRANKGGESSGSATIFHDISDPATAAPPPDDPVAALGAAMQKMMEMLWEVLSMKAVAPKASSNNHLLNAKLDERCFRNVAKFTNNPSDWEKCFLNAVRECDAVFANQL